MASVNRTTASSFVVGKMLKGSDLGRASSVDVKIVRVRVTPSDWGSPFVLDIEEVHGCENMALNKTNSNKLSELIDDETDNWAGYTVTFNKEETTNPKTNLSVFGLVVVGVAAPSIGGKKKK